MATTWRIACECRMNEHNIAILSEAESEAASESNRMTHGPDFAPGFTHPPRAKKCPGCGYVPTLVGIIERD
ncbi:MAG: hypothetical protein MPL62_04425 [Alphaproteobacteria bacterium]|nr:hypothetical protein [Alphaproteobacteria bacterium]